MNAKEYIVFVFIIPKHKQQSIVQSHSPSQDALTNFNFSNHGGGGGTPAGRLVNFDSFSEIGY